MELLDIKQVIENLEKEWDIGGFLENVRRGQFVASKGDRFLDLLDNIDLNNVDLVPKRLLSLIWYIPIFIEWQRDRVQETGHNVLKYDQFVTKVQNTLENVIGVP